MVFVVNGKGFCENEFISSISKLFLSPTLPKNRYFQFARVS